MADTWTAPAVERREPAEIANERESLEQFLDYHRDTLRQKCSGLTAEQLKAQAVHPSTLTLLGIVRHMTDVERWWFRMHASGEDVDLRFWGDTLTDDFDGVAGADAASDLEAYDREIGVVKATVAGVDLEKVVSRLSEGSDERMSVRWIYLHMIEEYARHNGHADLLREALDGATGE